MLNHLHPTQMPEVALEKARRSRFFKHRGRAPRDEIELQEFDNELRVLTQQADKQTESELNREKEQQLRIDQERDALQFHRLMTRYNEVGSDISIASLEALKISLKDRMANFSGVKLIGDGDDRITTAKIENLDASNTNMTNGIFTNLRFGKSTNFSKVDFSGSTFTDVKFEAGSLVGDADFTDAKFYNTIFEEGSFVRGADFRRASFDNKCSLEFDSNFIAQAKFDMPLNSWQRLLKSYTGVTQFLNIVFGFLYFGPLILKILLLGILSNLHKPEIGQDTSAVWLVVMGGQDFEFRIFFLAIAILGYQALRFRVTMRLSPLIDEQKVGGRTPRVDEYRASSVQQPYITAFGYFVFAMFAYDLFVAATATVCIPLSACIR